VALLSVRDKAWLLYGVIDWYTRRWWEELIRCKLCLHESVLETFKKDYANNAMEMKYRTLHYWIQQECLGWF